MESEAASGVGRCRPHFIAVFAAAAVGLVVFYQLPSINGPRVVVVQAPTPATKPRADPTAVKFVAQPVNLSVGARLAPFTENASTGLLDHVPYAAWDPLPAPDKRRLFRACIHQQADRLLQTLPAPEKNVSELQAFILPRLAREKRRVVGVLYFGRRRYVKLLLPFLTRNLRRRGGLLDHVVVCLTTGDGDDRAYAAAALTGASFRRFEPPSDLPLMEQWLHFWNTLRTDRSAIYVKFDDDLVFVEDGAVEWLVYEKLRRPEFIVLSANVINHSQLPYLHWRMGLLLGQFQYYGHVTPRMAAVQHAAFLAAMEAADNGNVSYAAALRRYHFGLWDQSVCLCDAPQLGAARLDHGLPFCNQRGHYRWSINMFIIEAADMVKPAQQQDELFFSNYLPTIAGDRRTGVVGRAVAVHAMYHSQRAGISESRENKQWLARYQRLAERYCAAPLTTAAPARPA
eukprot:EG_transcript_9840